LFFRTESGRLPGVAEFRYAQYCPLARAAEIVAERWTLLIARELLLGPRRFSDLRRSLAGVSASVLSERLAALEANGIVSHRELPPPTPAALYELTALGQRLYPAIRELARFGLHFHTLPKRGDRFEPEWVRLALQLFARDVATPARSYRVEIAADAEAVRFRVQGGRSGTRVLSADGAAATELVFRTPLAAVAVASGRRSHRDAQADGSLRASGDLEALADFPLLFEMQPPDAAPAR
jgi:DNA-binding HxlR family transcriptional regulator